MRRPALHSLAILLFVVGSTVPAQAEVVEEIVAWVNGEIVTRSQIESEEQLMIAEAYRRFTGDELDEQVKALKQSLLMDMIDRRILLGRAQMLFSDLDQIREVYYKGFRESQGVEDEAEFERMLSQEGMTVEAFKNRLLQLYAPDEVLRIEVRDRISLSDAEIQEFYKANPAQFRQDDEVTLREIVLLASTEEARELRREEAEKIREELLGGAEFAEVAKRVSEAGTRAEGGLLGPLAKGDLSPRLEEVAFEMPVGEVSEVLEMDYGFHIVQVESRKVDYVRPLEEIKDQLSRFLEERKYLEELERFLTKARTEAEWCVKDKFRNRIDSELATMMTCQNL